MVCSQPNMIYPITITVISSAIVGSYLDVSKNSTTNGQNTIDFIEIFTQYSPSIEMYILFLIIITSIISISTYRIIIDI